MNSVRKWIRNIFGFSGNEINGFLVLIPLMLVLVFSEPLYRAWIAGRERSYPEDSWKLDSLVAVLGSRPLQSSEVSAAGQISHFSFDPNTAKVEDLLQLGFSPTSANRIAAYRRNGGVFRVKSDLMKIYGLDSTLYKQLYDYITLPTRRLVQPNPAKAQSRPESFRVRRMERNFDLNTADTSLLKTVYGIGPTLAARIVKFRDGLGGFVSARQLNEVYGLDSTVVTRLLDRGFIETGFIPKQINLNTATETELSRHPYARFNMARVIVNYRFQHGDFTDASDIKKLSALKPEEVERLLPYLKVKD